MSGLARMEGIPHDMMDLLTTGRHAKVSALVKKLEEDCDTKLERIILAAMPDNSDSSVTYGYYNDDDFVFVE